MRRIWFVVAVGGSLLMLAGCVWQAPGADQNTDSQKIRLSELGQTPAPPTEEGETQTLSSDNHSSPPPMPGKQYSQPPEMKIDPKKRYTAVFHTQAGNIEITLHAAKTPLTVNNFIFLAREGFYDGTVFHRVIKGFMIQGGDPRGDGTGGPGYQFDDEKFSGAYTRGIVAMANAGPDTNGSQFFIMHTDYSLPPNYVIFGEVKSGLETVDKIATAATKAGPGGENSTPVSSVKIEKIDIREE